MNTSNGKKVSKCSIYPKQKRGENILSNINNELFTSVYPSEEKSFDVFLSDIKGKVDIALLGIQYILITILPYNKNQMILSTVN